MTSNDLSSKRAVLVGGAGFLGAFLTKELLSQHMKVVCVDMEGADYSRLDGLDVEIAHADITKPETLEGLFTQGDWVYHLVGILGAAQAPRSVYEKLNIVGTENVVHAAITQGAAKFIFMSSFSAVGPVASLDHPLNEESVCAPADDYGWSKREAEKQITKLAEGKIATVILRTPILFGPEPNVISSTAILFKTAAKKRSILVGKADATFPICYVKNVAEALYYLANYHPKGVHTYMYADGDPLTMKETLTQISAAFGTRTTYYSLPKAPVMFMASILEKLMPIFGKKSPLTVAVVKGMTENVYHYDITKLKSTGFVPSKTLSEGIADTVTWMKENQ